MTDMPHSILLLFVTLWITLIPPFSVLHLHRHRMEHVRFEFLAKLGKQLSSIQRTAARG